MTLPRGTRRLFAHVPLERLDPRRHEPAIVERLLEDGDRADLRWLTAKIPEARLASWLRERGARRLSRRSRAFWCVVLDVGLEPRASAGESLWPH